MKRLITLTAALITYLTMAAQTLNVVEGQTIYQIPAAQTADMPFTDGTTVTILNKVYTISNIDQMYIDNTEVTDNTVNVVYENNTAKVYVAGNAARFLTVTTNGAHVKIVQSEDLADELTYTLSGNSSDGEFYLEGSFKATVALAGLTLTNPSGAPVNIQDGKRIEVSIKNGTTNTLTDSANGDQKGCFVCKGHTEFKGKGTLNIYGNSAHGIWSKEYVEIKNCTINILAAAKDGINCNQYFMMESGALNIKGIGDDALQVSYEDDGTDEEDTGSVNINGGTLDFTVTGDGAKGIKAENTVNMTGGQLTVTQTGNLVVTGNDLSYPTSVKADGDINITGGTLTIVNTAEGGKALSADGSVNISEQNASTTINITANGKGGTAETSGSDDEGDTPTQSYKVYVSLPTSGGGGGGPGGGGNTWSSVYLYKSDGTLVQRLTSTVTKSSGYSTATFYYYDFKAASSDSYYFKSDDYNSRGTTYTIVSETFNGPNTGEDIYYSVSNSYTTSGYTRTYKLSNVTSTYGGTSDISEDSGTAYNAVGIKADANVDIKAGTIVINNNGAMSKSIKSKAEVNIDGGDITLNPSGAMQVINNDASYSSGVKTKEFVMNNGKLEITAKGSASRGISATNITTNGGTLKITNSGAGQTGSNDSYTAKGLKADSKIALNAGTITISMSGTGGKGIKSSGTYTQGVSGGEGPTLTVTTTGSSLGGSGGGGMGMGGNSGSSAKAIKVMGNVTLYGGSSEIYTSTDGAEGLESKTAIYIEGGQHYLKCYDDCINSSGNIYFNGGVCVAYSNGNDAIDSNAGRTGAITIGNGTVFAYTTKGGPEEGFDCDNNSYIQITGTGIAISAGGSQGGGGGGPGGGSSGNTISNAKQGYAFVTSSISYSANRYYTLSDGSNNNLVTYSFPASVSSQLALFTATGMKSGTTYYVKYSTAAPTDATTSFHGLYLGSSAVGSTSVTSFSAK